MFALLTLQSSSWIHGIPSSTKTNFCNRPLCQASVRMNLAYDLLTSTYFRLHFDEAREAGNFSILQFRDSFLILLTVDIQASVLNLSNIFTRWTSTLMTEDFSANPNLLIAFGIHIEQSMPSVILNQLKVRPLVDASSNLTNAHASWLDLTE